MSLSLYFSAIAILVSLISFCWDYSLQQKVAKIQSEEHQFRLEELAEKNQLKITANELRKLQKSIKKPPQKIAHILRRFFCNPKSLLGFYTEV